MAKRRTRRYPEKERFWRRAIRRQRKSGLTVSAFCTAEGLKDWSFHWWRRELAKRNRETPTAKRVQDPQNAPSFVPVQLVPERANELQLRDAIDQHPLAAWLIGLGIYFGFSLIPASATSRSKDWTSTGPSVYWIGKLFHSRPTVTTSWRESPQAGREPSDFDFRV